MEGRNLNNMSVKPLVSTIIPVYDRDSLLGETLGSLIGQSYPRCEGILVDDGSSENTLNSVLSIVACKGKDACFGNSEVEWIDDVTPKIKQ